jgi:hypothetical protein
VADMGEKEVRVHTGVYVLVLIGIISASGWLFKKNSSNWLLSNFRFVSQGTLSVASRLSGNAYGSQRGICVRQSDSGVRGAEFYRGFRFFPVNIIQSLLQNYFHLPTLVLPED